jgi:hypothetical protein
LIIRAVVAETTLCTGFGGFGMVVEVSKLEEKRVHSLLHDTPYSAVYERDNQGLLLALSIFWLR